MTMVDTAALLAAYDAQMRMPSSTVPAGVTYERDGPVVRIVGGHVGRVRTPRDLGVTGAAADRLIGVVLRQVSAAEDLRRFADLQTEVTGFDCSWVAADLGARLSADPGQITILAAEAGARFVATAVTVYEPGTDFVAAT